MSGEILAILGVGVALAGVILTSNRGLRQDLTRLESRLIRGSAGWSPRLVNSANAWRTWKDCWKDCARPSPGGPGPANERGG